VARGVDPDEVGGAAGSGRSVGRREGGADAAEESGPADGVGPAPASGSAEQPTSVATASAVTTRLRNMSRP
jgi:hypothetical protein